MRTNQPPSAATWLLRLLGCSSQNEAIIGDLMERYRQGHSPLWYWSQVAVAIVTGFATEVRLTKLFIVRGLLVGTAFQVGLAYGMRNLKHLISPQRVWEYSNLFLALGILIVFVGCAINGRVLARLHRAHGRAVILAFVALQFLTMLKPSGRVPMLQSWIFAVGGAINALIFQLGGPDGMPLLNALCDICATGVTYRVLHLLVSALISVAILLIGSGLLREDSDESVQSRLA